MAELETEALGVEVLGVDMGTVDVEVLWEQLTFWRGPETRALLIEPLSRDFLPQLAGKT